MSATDGPSREGCACTKARSVWRSNAVDGAAGSGTILATGFPRRVMITSSPAWTSASTQKNAIGLPQYRLFSSAHPLSGQTILAFSDESVRSVGRSCAICRSIASTLRHIGARPPFNTPPAAPSPNRPQGPRGNSPTPKPGAPRVRDAWRTAWRARHRSRRRRR